MVHSRAIVLALAFAVNLAAAKKPVTVETVVNAPSTRFPGAEWAPDGERYIEKDGGQLSLYEVKSGKERVVIALDELERAAVKPPAGEAYDWTNRRVGEREVQWFADGKRLLVAEAGDLFVVDVGKGRFEALTQTAQAERDPKLSPDNQYVSFRRGADLYTVEVSSKIVLRLTANGSDTLLNGELDWVYPEELDIDTAHWWSPDSRSIAISAVRYFARAGVSPGVAGEHAGNAGARAIPAARRSECRRAPGSCIRYRRRDSVDGSGRHARVSAGARGVVAIEPGDSG